jgi:hypothetical protein
MRILILLLLAADLALSQAPAGAAGQKQPDPAAARGSQAAQVPNAAEATFSERVKQIANSGRVQLIGETSATRLQPAASLAPGAPPILAFRYFDGLARHRFGDLDLVMDDAGH